LAYRMTNTERSKYTRDALETTHINTEPHHENALGCGVIAP